ncbi:DUF3397 family protein [Lysinibacillus sp. MHQ-1]|nr:DUF3397 family protein [Lysinibacillus sp. MHQ-1]
MFFFIIVYLISRKVKIRGTHAFGAASDVTTFCLFFSVPLGIGVLWQINVGGTFSHTCNNDGYDFYIY